MAWTPLPASPVRSASSASVPSRSVPPARPTVVSRGGPAREASPAGARDRPVATLPVMPLLGRRRGGTRAWWARWALLPHELGRDVLFEAREGRLTAVRDGVAERRARQQGAEVLPGVVLPGLANAHSHAFHRALRGRTHTGEGTFWTWRERMYDVAARLDPDTSLALARATYGEMALAGITHVGEFHYVHHQPDGTPYVDPNAMGLALVQAAAEAGIGLTLLDTAYLAGGLGPQGYEPLAPRQLRFADRDAAGRPSAHAWAERFGALCASVTQRGERENWAVGAALHSVRAVPPDAAQVVAAAADGWPLHVHLSEQPAENEACVAHHGRTPTRLLDDLGALSQFTTAVHATHLTSADIARLGERSVTACFCPTTERDLADGLGPAVELLEHGVRLALGSDSHAVIDPFEEARALEMHERLRSGQRGRLDPGALLEAATAHDTLGGVRGRLETGLPADLVAVRLDTVRTAGCDPAQVLLAATAADVDTVVVGGRVVVRGGRHLLLEQEEPLGIQLQRAIRAVTGPP